VIYIMFFVIGINMSYRDSSPFMSLNWSDIFGLEQSKYATQNERQ
jgi:hypothetical protein